MAVLRYYKPNIHDVYRYPTQATPTSGGIAPNGYNSECQSYDHIDWSGTSALHRNFCNNIPNNSFNNIFFTIPYDRNSVNFWNQCTYGAVLISPRHALICQHFRGARPDPNDNTGGIRFLGKSGAFYENKVTRVYLNIGPDTTMLEFDKEFPDSDVKIYNRIADPLYIPTGTSLWTKDSNGKIYKTLFKSAYLDTTTNDTRGYNFNACLDGINDGAFRNGALAIFAGDSGSPVMVRDAYGDTVFVGLEYGGQSISKATFAKLVAALTPFGYKVQHVKLSAKMEDINQDGVVDQEDLNRILARWGQTKPVFEDMDGDGKVDGIDLSRVLAAWGSYNMPTFPQAVVNPGTVITNPPTGKPRA